MRQACRVRREIDLRKHLMARRPQQSIEGSAAQALLQAIDAAEAAIVEHRHDQLLRPTSPR